MVSTDDVRASRAGYGCAMLLRALRDTSPRTRDLLLAGAFLVESQLEVALLVGYGSPNAALAAVLLAIQALGLSVRRLEPVTCVTLIMVPWAALMGLGHAVNDNLYSIFFVMLFCLYSAGRWGDGRRLIVAGVIIAVCQTIGTAVDPYRDSVLDYVLGAVVLGGGPILLGRVVRNRTRLNRALREKTARLQRERAVQAEQAALDERTRIAGELHDVVAHAMSGMVVQASAARRLAERDQDRARDAFAAVETTGREALTEIRRLLGVLRRDDEEIALAPQPSLRHLTALVQRTGAAGLPVELAIEGEERPLPAGVDLTAYRLVQEALASAIEQGAAGRARVLVRYRPDGIEVEIVDDGAGDGPRQLVGVPERVGLYGGQLHAGRPEGGGHAVRARLPVGAGS
jgi:signal transduction histidine kinase